MGELSWWHWMIIIAAFVILFGYKRLPDAACGVGRSLRILKSEVAAMGRIIWSMQHTPLIGVLLWLFTIRVVTFRSLLERGSSMQ